MKVKAHTMSNSSIYIDWYDPSLDRDQVIRDGRFYTVRYYNYEEGLIKYVNVSDQQATILGLKAETEYHFEVRSMNPPFLSKWSDQATNRTADQTGIFFHFHCHVP